MIPAEFIRKWTASNLRERSASHEHFLDLCRLLGEPTPAEVDPGGKFFSFDKEGTTAGGGQGFADAWKQGCFALEYKGPGGDLIAAYKQLKNYAEMLGNPPLLIVSDTKRIEIHTNFTNTVKKVYRFELADLEEPGKRDLLKQAFCSPERLKPGVTREMVTTEAAEQFSQLAHHLQAKGFEPQRVAHFLNRLIFCMFAEDVGLLPNQIFSRLASASVAHPEAFETNARQLFAAMAKGGPVHLEVIDWFNGGLFDDDATLPLDKKELEIVLKCAALDWSNIEPSIFGTLFERGLDPDKRSQQGTHYTDPETIMKLVGPVVLEPWRREWEAEKAELMKLIAKAKRTVSAAARKRYKGFLERLSNFKVLDPACGSGNFLYLSLRALKDFERRVINEAEALGLERPFPRVGPESVFGIEVNPYAAELARVTIWIGELQWMLENGFGAAKNPILKPLDQIECRDAILNDDGTEPEWPKAHAIVGNPPFLGGKKQFQGLGRQYTEAIRRAYIGRLPGGADLCCYWFEKAWQAIAAGNTQRAGLVATNAIRRGSNRAVLDTITSHGSITDAWSDLPWILDGAAVRVSLICFSAEQHGMARLDGQVVERVHPDLSSGHTDVTRIAPLKENAATCYLGVQKSGPLDVDGDLARRWLLLPANPNGSTNAAVLSPFFNGDDITSRPRDRWLIDFPAGATESRVSLFQEPFEYLKAVRYQPDDPADLRTLREARAEARDKHARERWWDPYWPRPEMRSRIASQSRYLVTPETPTYTLFAWLPSRVVPDKNLIVIARDDDTSFGVLHSAMHLCWVRAIGSPYGNHPTARRYNSSRVFETFPFPKELAPNIPAAEYANDPCAQRIATAAKRLNELRENWLNPSQLVDRVPEVVSAYPDRLVPKNPAAAQELSVRTLTNLYNTKPTWLQHAHRDLDEAVAAAYGWEWPLADDEVLSRLFKLNQQRANGL